MSSYGGNGKMIIFTRTKHEADKCYKFSQKYVKGVGVMHGDIA